MANKEMTLKERYVSFCNEAEAIKAEFCDARRNSENTKDITDRLEKLVNNTLADIQPCEFDLGLYISLSELVIKDFKMNKKTIDEVIEYVMGAFKGAEALRYAEEKRELEEKRADDIRTFCLECAENLAYPEKVRNFFLQCAKNARCLIPIVYIN